MTHFKVDIQLPRYYNLKKGEKKRNEIPPNCFFDTYEELIDIAGGVNTSKFQIQGSWVSPQTNERYNDESILFSVLIKSNGKSRIEDIPQLNKIKRYKKKLLKRFEQKAIYMIATPCYLM